MIASAWAALAALPTRDLPWAVVDVETTGLSPNQGDRVVEVAVLRVEPDGRRELFASLVNPGRRISPAAQAVNGILEADLEAAPSFAQVAGDLMARVGEAVFVAHNADFDVPFLLQELALAGMEPPEIPVLDTLALARRCFRFPSNRLGDVARALGVRSTRAHRAGDDVATTFAILERMLPALATRGHATLGDLLRVQGPVAGFRPMDPGELLDEPLATALRDGRPVAIRYLGRDAPSDRVVRPIALRGSTLVAYCALRRAERNFRLDRIAAAWWPEGEV